MLLNRTTLMSSSAYRLSCCYPVHTQVLIRKVYPVISKMFSFLNKCKSSKANFLLVITATFYTLINIPFRSSPWKLSTPSPLGNLALQFVLNPRQQHSFLSDNVLIFLFF